MMLSCHMETGVFRHQWSLTNLVAAANPWPKHPSVCHNVWKLEMTDRRTKICKIRDQSNPTYSYQPVFWATHHLRPKSFEPSTCGRKTGSNMLHGSPPVVHQSLQYSMTIFTQPLQNTSELNRFLSTRTNPYPNKYYSRIHNSILPYWITPLL